MYKMWQKFFLAKPKSDALNTLDFICSDCKGEKSGFLSSLFEIFKPKH
ncbi:TPA: hypothetical protein RZL97_000172 [Campylobacter jejuni]|nr:hypothetical protein [Campylobacter jejuni]